MLTYNVTIASHVTEKKKPETTADKFAATLNTLLADPGVIPSKTRGKTQATRKVLPIGGEEEGEENVEDEDEATADLPNKRRKLSTPTSDPKPPLSQSTQAVKQQKQKPTVKNPILSLSNRRLPPSRAALSLERRAVRQLKQEKEERLDRARIRDVMEGWGPREVLVNVVGTGSETRVGPGGKKGAEGKKVKEVVAPGGQEWERGLRKVAQKGGECTRRLWDLESSFAHSCFLSGTLSLVCI